MSKKPLFAMGLLAVAISTAYAQSAPAASSASGQPAALSDYLRLPQYASPRLSPDGKRLAISTPVNGHLNLAVVELDTRKGTALTNFSEFDVVDVVWVGNDRLVFSLGQVNAPSGLGQADGGGLFVVSADGKESRTLSPTARGAGTANNSTRGMQLLRLIPGNSEEVLVTAALRSSDSVDIYRLNLRTGRTTLVNADRPSRTNDFVLDHKLVPRIAMSTVKDELVEIVSYRSTADSPWKEIARFTPPASKGAFTPLGFLSDDKTLLVSANPNRDTRAIYKYDPETQTLGELVAQHPRYDMGAGSVIVEPETDRIIGYRVNAERPQTVWLDEKEARTQALIDRALPNLVNRFSRFPNSSRLLVASYSDVSPAKYYLLDEDKKTLEELFNSTPWLGPEQLVQMRPFLLKTRDGLEIPSYYFLPKGYQPGSKLPTIIHIHGGPEARADSWASGYGYQESELLASRGYAVVLPNFRITPGLGAKIHQAGYGAVGRQMSEDHEDAAKWAIAQGFADPTRICIVGASYGGYATLVALAKTPELFKCGVAGLPVTDWQAIIDSPLSNSAYGSGPQYVKLILGEAKDKNALSEYSPVNMANRIKAPVFLWEGTDDHTTPVEQTRAMARALDRSGNPAKEVLIKADEGHGYGRAENKLDLYEKVLKFLDQQIGTAPTPR